jgi:hypothetical protein
VWQSRVLDGRAVRRVQLLPLMKTELYEWSRGLAGENATLKLEAWCFVAACLM